MIIENISALGSKLYVIRKKAGLTQAQAAEAAGLSNNAYAEIERGIVNTSVESIMQICRAFHITPNDIMTEEVPEEPLQEDMILTRLQRCTPHQKHTALRLLETYLQSLE